MNFTLTADLPANYVISVDNALQMQEALSYLQEQNILWCDGTRATENELINMHTIEYPHGLCMDKGTISHSPISFFLSRTKIYGEIIPFRQVDAPSVDAPECELFT